MGGSKGVILISGDTLKNEEQDHSCIEGSDKTCRSKRPGHFRLACYSICLGPRTEKPLMRPQLASQHKTAPHQRGLQQACTTCQSCQGPANMKHTAVLFMVQVRDAVTTA